MVATVVLTTNKLGTINIVIDIQNPLLLRQLIVTQWARVTAFGLHEA